MEKLLVTDIDGTITDQAYRLDSEVIDALVSLNRSGWDLFFLTGRYFSYAQKLFQNFPVPYLLGCQNGASVWSSTSLSWIYSQNLSREVLASLQEALGGFPVVMSIESGAQHQDYCYRFSPTSESQCLHELLDPIYFPTAQERTKLVHVKDLSTDYGFPSFAAAKIFGEENVVRDIYKSLSRNQGLLALVNLVLIQWPFDPKYSIVFITEKHVSKGHTLDRVIERLYGGKKPFIMASGDDNNDTDLILRGDYRIVMNSAPQELHGIADFLAPPAEEKGILPAWEAGDHYFNAIAKV